MSTSCGCLDDAQELEVMHAARDLVDELTERYGCMTAVHEMVLLALAAHMSEFMGHKDASTRFAWFSELILEKQQADRVRVH